jgi:alpha-tubulin suppressor-like RCC1 family protein
MLRGCFAALAGLAAVMPLAANAVRLRPLPHPATQLTSPVAVFFGGPGSGRVTALPGGINCSSDCTGALGIGRTVRLTATPAAGSVFAGWGGKFAGSGHGNLCSGEQPTCQVTPTRAGGQVIAYFRSAFKTVVAGAYHTCVLRPTGDVTCWGRNLDGQLGRGPVPGTLNTLTTAFEAPGPTVKFWIDNNTHLGKAVAIAAGGFHTCALIVNGEVQCWGNNDWGQVVPYGNEPGPTPSPLVVTDGYHTCVVEPGGTASCWGNNQSGQLGDGTNNLPTNGFTATVNLAGVGPLTRTIVAGGFHTCAIVALDSTVACWGDNADGQVGSGSTRGYEPIPGARVQLGCARAGGGGCAPLASTTLLKASAIAASIGVGQISLGQYGGFHTVALDTSGGDWGWGNNTDNQVSVFNYGGQNFNFAMPGVITANTISPTKIAAGAFHTCMLSVTEGVFCHGHNGNGESGPTPNTSNKADAVPLTTGPGIRAVDLAAGGFHTCAVVTGITSDPAGSVLCWGENGDGQVNGIPGGNVNFPTLLLAP